MAKSTDRGALLSVCKIFSCKQVDALYSLPSTLLCHAPVFGSSTRADWENTLKNKRDSTNPYASPGNYNISNLYVLSTKSTSAKTVFQCASREPPSETSSPGPVSVYVPRAHSLILLYRRMILKAFGEMGATKR